MVEEVAGAADGTPVEVEVVELLLEEEVMGMYLLCSFSFTESIHYHIKMRIIFATFSNQFQSKG